MDVIGKIVQSGSCAADGTVAASRNPLTNMLDTMLDSGAASAAQRPAGAAVDAPPSQFHAMEQHMRRAHDAQLPPGPKQMDMLPPQFHHPPPPQRVSVSSVPTRFVFFGS